MSAADFLPRRYGARADGVTKDTAAIQAAIDAAGNAACASPTPPPVALKRKAFALLYEIGRAILSAYDCYED